MWNAAAWATTHHVHTPVPRRWGWRATAAHTQREDSTHGAQKHHSLVQFAESVSDLVYMVTKSAGRQGSLAMCMATAQRMAVSRPSEPHRRRAHAIGQWPMPLMSVPRARTNRGPLLHHSLLPVRSESQHIPHAQARRAPPLSRQTRAHKQMSPTHRPPAERTRPTHAHTTHPRAPQRRPPPPTVASAAG